jgi:hypothetical protein
VRVSPFDFVIETRALEIPRPLASRTRPPTETEAAVGAAATRCQLDARRLPFGRQRVARRLTPVFSGRTRAQRVDGPLEDVVVRRLP